MGLSLLGCYGDDLINGIPGSNLGDSHTIHNNPINYSSFKEAPWWSYKQANTLLILGLLSSKAQKCEDLWKNHVNPVILVFIGKLSLSTLR